MSDSLSDIEQDALSVAVRIGLADLERELGLYHANAWPARLAHWQRLGQVHLGAGITIRQAQTLKISVAVSRGLAALSMAPGGVRVGGIVFCATHSPGGVESRWRFSCAVCDPDALSIYEDGHTDVRDVITMEGGHRL